MSKHDNHLGALEEERHGFHGFPALPGFVRPEPTKQEVLQSMNPSGAVEKEET